MSLEEGLIPVSGSKLPSTQISLQSLVQLNNESTRLLQQIISESDLQKTKDLTYLFNINQNKKTAVRINKLNGLLDLIADEAVRRLSERPDQISTKELLDSLKIVQSSIQTGQRQIADQLQAAPTFIQINNQTNEINMSEVNSLDRESRNRVKDAVMGLLSSLTSAASQSIEAIQVEEFEDQPEDSDEENA